MRRMHGQNLRNGQDAWGKFAQMLTHSNRLTLWRQRTRPCGTASSMWTSPVRGPPTCFALITPNLQARTAEPRGVAERNGAFPRETYR